MAKKDFSDVYRSYLDVGYFTTLAETEGFVPLLYKPEGEKPRPFYTIGFGTSIPESEALKNPDFRVSVKDAVLLMISDVRKIEEKLREHGFYAEKMHIGVYTALVDFCYNVGFKHLLSPATNIHEAFFALQSFEDTTSARLAFLSRILKRYVWSGGRVLRGLVKRANWRCGYLRLVDSADPATAVVTTYSDDVISEMVQLIETRLGLSRTY